MRKITILTISLISGCILAGCANVNVTVNTNKEEPVQENPVKEDMSQPEQPDDDESEKNRALVEGPYGSLSIEILDNWQYKICDINSEDLIGERYGIIFSPKDAKDDQIELFITDTFGVCGTGLKQEETTIGGMPARIGTYDDHEHWDYVAIGDEPPQIVATRTVCDSWDDKTWQEAWQIIESLSYDPTNVTGCIWQYTPESEDTDIAVLMEMEKITPAGAVIKISHYDWEKTGEIIAGESFSLEKENNGKWEDVPKIIDDAVFNDIGYPIPENETTEIETNWEWLYGPLSPGTYKIKKTVIDRTDDGYTEHELAAQFLVAGPYVKDTITGDFGTYYEMDDGTWLYDGHIYKYRLEISGRMNSSAKDSTFIYLSNIEDISFDRAVMASGLSSNTADYFSPEEAVFIGWKD